MLDGLAAARGTEDAAGAELGTTLQRLAPRWFVVRNAHSQFPPILMNPRYAMSLTRGPMTRVEIRRARGGGRPKRVVAVEVGELPSATT